MYSPYGAATYHTMHPGVPGMVPGAAEAAALQSHSHSWAGPPCELAHSGGIPMSQMMHHDVYTELGSSATSGYGVNIHGVGAPGPAPHPHASMGYVSMMPSHEGSWPMPPPGTASSYAGPGVDGIASARHGGRGVPQPMPDLACVSSR